MKSSPSGDYRKLSKKSGRDPAGVSAVGVHRDLPDDPPGAAHGPAAPGAQERTDRGHLERDRPRERDLDAPKQRMKGRNPHVVYLSRKALHILVALHTCAAGSMFVLPSHYGPIRCMSHATLSRVAQLIVERAKAVGLPLEPFTVHDLRRTGSTLLNEGLQRRLDRKVPRARRGALLALGLQQGRVRRATAPHAAGVGGHGRCLDRRANPYCRSCSRRTYRPRCPARLCEERPHDDSLGNCCRRAGQGLHRCKKDHYE